MTLASPDVVRASAGEGASRFVILVHGGAGDVPAERVAAHVEGCLRAAREGAKVLAADGTALDAVERAVAVLEDDPLFNAGTGACLARDGRIELDASIMDGTTLKAGAVCALPPFSHPIAIARRVMEASPHVLLAGDGAARFAEANGFARAEEASMITAIARARWEAVQNKEIPEGWAGGTVGAVARDATGRVAAATSTGGMVNKLPGRVGDSPIIGAGTYADDESGACSTTGHGEAMIRLVIAKGAIDAIRAGASAEEAARTVIARMHDKTQKTGGLIVAAKNGSIGLARTTQTMTWAFVNAEGERSGA